MAYLGTFRGTGRIIVQDVDIGGATYEVHVYRDDIPAGSFQTPGATLPGLKEARGEIEADPSAIGQVKAARMAILQIESEESIQFFIGRWDYISRNADITVTGAIPWP